MDTNIITSSEPASEHSSVQRPTFLSLPIELRLKIYKCYADDYGVSPVRRFWKTDEKITWREAGGRSYAPIPPLMLVCQQVYGKFKSDLTNLCPPFFVFAIGPSPDATTVKASHLRLADGQKHRARTIRFTLEVPNDDLPRGTPVDVRKVVLQAARQKQVDVAHSHLQFFKGRMTVEYCGYYTKEAHQPHLQKLVEDFMFAKVNDGVEDLEIASVRVLPYVYMRKWKLPNSASWGRQEFPNIRTLDIGKDHTDTGHRWREWYVH